MNKILTLLLFSYLFVVTSFAAVVSGTVTNNGVGLSNGSLQLQLLGCSNPLVNSSSGVAAVQSYKFILDANGNLPNASVSGNDIIYCSGVLGSTYYELKAFNASGGLIWDRYYRITKTIWNLNTANVLTNFSVNSYVLTNPPGDQIISTPTNNRLSLVGGPTLIENLQLGKDPVNSSDAATKNYVDTSIGSQIGTSANIANKVNRTGDTMTGPLVLANDPTTSLQASTKNYVDTSITGLNAVVKNIGSDQILIQTGVSALTTVGNFNVLPSGNASTPYVPFIPGISITSSTIASGENPINIAVSGQYAYVMASGSAPSQIVTVDVRTMAIVGTYSLTGCAGGGGLLVKGQYLYYDCYDTGTVGILQLPSNYTGGSYTLSPISTVSTTNPSRQMSIVGNTLWVPSGSSVVYKIDITTAASPSILGTYSVTPSNTLVSAIADQDYVYVAAPSGSASYVVILSNSGSQVGSVAVNHSPQSIYLQYPYLFVSYHDANSIDMINISLPSSPIITSTYSLPTGCNPIPVMGQGNSIYTGCYDTGNLYKLEISSDSKSLNMIGGLFVGAGIQSITPSERFLYVSRYSTSAPIYKLDLGGIFSTKAQFGDISSKTLEATTANITNINTSVLSSEKISVGSINTVGNMNATTISATSNSSSSISTPGGIIAGTGIQASGNSFFSANLTVNGSTLAANAITGTTLNLSSGVTASAINVGAGGIIYAGPAPTSTTGQVSEGNSLAAASNCNQGGVLTSVVGCRVINIAGTLRYTPYF